MPECQVWVAQELDAPQLLGFVAVKDDVLEHLPVPGASPTRNRQPVAQAGLPGEPGPADPAGLHAKHRRARLLRAARFQPLDENDGSRNEENEPDTTYGWTRYR